jgi:hypothetical protein
MIHNDVKKAVENADISTLRYFFCDCLDGDPTFSEYEEDYEYCKANGILFVPHCELHPMNCNRVDENYWIQLKKDFMQNPSVERMEHMREVAKILYSDRIRKIEENNVRKSAVRTEEKPAQTVGANIAVSVAKTVSDTAPQQNVRAKSPVHKSDEPARPSETVRRVSEPVSPVNEVRRESVPVGKVTEEPRTPKGTPPKKSNGVGRSLTAVLVIAVAMIIIICLLIK